MESEKCRKYQRFYQRQQRLAFAPMGHKLFRTMRTRPSTILMEPCWPLCTSNILIFSWMKTPLSLHHPIPIKQHTIRKLRGQKYNANEFLYFNRQRILICIFEGITTRIYGITFNLTCSPQYTKWFEQLRRNIPKFDLYLVSSQNSTIFSIQQFNAQPHNPCSF